jgi:hypothetical protein
MGWLLSAVGYRVRYVVAQINRSPAVDGYAQWSPYTHLVLVVGLPQPSAASQQQKENATPNSDEKQKKKGAAAAAQVGYEFEDETLWLVDVAKGSHPGTAHSPNSVVVSKCSLSALLCRVVMCCDDAICCFVVF